MFAAIWAHHAVRGFRSAPARAAGSLVGRFAAVASEQPFGFTLLHAPVSRTLSSSALLTAAGDKMPATHRTDSGRMPPAGSPAAPFPKLGDALTFTPVTLGGEDGWMRAELPRARHDGSMKPVFLTTKQHDELQRFIKEGPNDAPQMLMPVGTIKSGKSTIVHTVLPGMLSAAAREESWSASGRGYPVIFKFQFPLKRNAAAAAQLLLEDLDTFIRSIRLHVPSFYIPPSGSRALNKFPGLLLKIAEAIHARGGELWLLLDEVQAPILYSSPELAGFFTDLMKRIVGTLSPYSRIVMTGSGMVSLLNSIRSIPPNGFTLWGSISFLSVGSEPSSQAATAMRQHIVAAHAAQWTADKRMAITPDAVAQAMERFKTAGIANHRPALLSFVMSLMGDANRGTAADIISAATQIASNKLQNESEADFGLALLALSSTNRTVVRAIAAGRYTWAQLESIAAGTAWFLAPDARTPLKRTEHRSLATLIMSLCEPGSGQDRVQLQPPYSALLLSWVSPDGELAIDFEDEEIILDRETNHNLKVIAQRKYRQVVVRQHPELRAAVSRAVMQSLADDGIGVLDLRDGEGAVLRPPISLAEFEQVQGLQAMRHMLDSNMQIDDEDKVSTLSERLQPIADAEFADKAGWEVLVAFRNFNAHVWGDCSPVVHNGLAAYVVMHAVHAASRVLAREGRDLFVMKNGRLLPTDKLPQP